MTRTIRNLGLAALAVLGLSAASQAMPAASRVTLPTGKKIFVSGMNLAWINYANDVVNFDSAAMATAIKAVKDSGGNTMRIWLSTDGSKDPVFNAAGYVSGPHPNTVANIQKMLRIAKKYDMLLILCMMSHNFMNNANGANLTYNHRMLQTDSGISMYVRNWVTPVAKAIGADPNILCWEVFNEPEGMVLGWFQGQTVSMLDVKKVVNRVAGAIHRAVPGGVLVSNGAVTMEFTSDVGGTNNYTDAALKAAGGDADGTLDFYMAHYYSSNGAGPSPFTKTYAYWNLDKPLVIGEYASEIFANETSYFNASSVDSLLLYLDKTGYAGGLGWMYYENAGMAGFKSYARSMKLEYQYDSASIKISGLSDHKFTVSVATTNGGTVTTSLTGRIDSLAIDTIKAVALPGYEFAGWVGDTTASGTTLVVKVDRDRMITANFVPQAGTNLIVNGDFAAGANSWGSLSITANTGNVATVDYATGKAVVAITSSDSIGWHMQLSQGDIKFDSAVTYVLTFDASASVAGRPLNIDFSSGPGTTPAWNWFGGGSVTLGTATKSYTIEVTVKGSSASGVLQFGLATSKAAPVAVTIDNVVLV